MCVFSLFVCLFCLHKWRKHYGPPLNHNSPQTYTPHLPFVYILSYMYIHVFFHSHTMLSFYSLRAILFNHCEPLADNHELLKRVLKKNCKEEHKVLILYLFGKNMHNTFIPLSDLKYL